MSCTRARHFDKFSIQQFIMQPFLFLGQRIELLDTDENGARCHNSILTLVMVLMAHIFRKDRVAFRRRKQILERFQTLS
jgi:hypothetical protein